MTEPYYADDKCQLYLGKMEEVLPVLAVTVNACITDPPYGETSLAWDRWVDGWPALVAQTTSSLAYGAGQVGVAFAPNDGASGAALTS